MIKLNLSGHQNKSLADQGFVMPAILHVDLSDPQLFDKLVDFLRSDCGVESDSVVTVALPGLAPLAVFVVTAIHGLTGHFPTIVPLVCSEEGGFSPVNPVPLQVLRNDVARASRTGLKAL